MMVLDLLPFSAFFFSSALAELSWELPSSWSLTETGSKKKKYNNKKILLTSC